LPDVHLAAFAALSPVVLYGIAKLRQDVFIVEQQCAYPDLDGRDAEPTARHLWIETDNSVVSALRLLDDGDGVHRISRVVTAADHRGRGLANALMSRAIELAGPPIVLNAQAHLEQWYAGFGFLVVGVGWDDGGIWHVPMRLMAGAGRDRV
jgi:ElaA protein